MDNESEVRAIVDAFCTAHWCKFQEAVSAAIGEEAWQALKLPPSAIQVETVAIAPVATFPERFAAR